LNIKWPSFGLEGSVFTSILNLQNIASDGLVCLPEPFVKVMTNLTKFIAKEEV
jgi:hypothetical protein